MASNSLHNLGGQKLPCPCYNTKNFEQIHWYLIFYRMYGLAVMLSIQHRLPCLLLIRRLNYCDTFKKLTNFFLPLLNCSIRSVREFTTKILESEQRIHILINNASVMWMPLRRTVEGHEYHWGYNHLACFVMTQQ